MSELHIVTTDDDIQSIRAKFSGANEVRWVFFARDYVRSRELRRALGKNFHSIDIAQVLDETAAEIRAEHVAWIDRMNRDNAEKAGWWFGVVSSRNVYSSNLFLYSCYLLVLQAIWRDASTRPDLIIADSRGLAESMERWIKSNAPGIRVVRRSSFKPAGKALRPLIGYAKSAAVAFSRFCAALFTRSHDTPPEVGAPCVVVDTFIHEDSISTEGNFKDRYYPFLHEFLSSTGIQVLVHPVLFGFRLDFWSIYRRMRISTTRFIIQEDYLRVADYAAAFLTPILLIFATPRCGAFRGVDLGPVVCEEHRFQDLGVVVQAVLAYRLWKRLHEAGLKIPRLIGWYENQVIDKALIKGARDAFPHARIVGVQMFMHSPNFLNLYPSESEREAGFTPDIVLTIGRYHAKVASRYASSIPTKPAAALRYSYLFDPARYGVERAVGGDAIFVLLPFSMGESLEILDLLLAAARGPLAGVSYQVKCHPDYSPEKLINAFGRTGWPSQLQIYQGNLSQAFDKATMIISSSSGSLVEAAVLGVPIIFVASQFDLNMNPLADLAGARYASCYNSDQLNKEIARLLSLPMHEREQLRRDGLAMRDNLFMPIEDEGLGRFLD